MAFTVLAIGLATFFDPLVRVEPPVLDKSTWSALDIAQHIYSRELPVPTGGFDLGVFEIAVTYLLIAIALVALFVPGGEEAIWIASLIGFVISAGAKYWNSTFESLFFGPFGGLPRGQVREGGAAILLAFVMAAVMTISLNESWDVFERRKKPTPPPAG